MSLLESLFSPGTIERLGWMLVHFLWQAMAVALLLAGLLRLLRRASANLRYAVACGAVALMAVLPLITMQLIEVSGPVAEAGPPPEISPPAMVEPLPVIVQTVDELPPLSSMPPLEAADLTVPIPLQERVIAALEPALPYVVLGWLAGVFGLSAWHLGGWAQLQRLRRRMTRKTEAPLHAALMELAERLGVRRAVTLLESAVVEVPTVVGWLRPVILLPASALTGLNPDQLRAILAHELAHIRRYDYFANILQTVVEILGFYHPAVWWVSTRIRIERENCCDDLAVQVCGNSLQYARALASMEEIRHSRSDLAMAASGGSLMARIARLLGRPAVDDRRFAWLPGLVALLLVIGVIIPAALVFATPAPAEPEPAEAELPAQPMAAPEPSPPLPDEPARTQVLLSFTVIDVFADRVFDLDTAVLARDLLTLIRPADANRPLVSTMPPIIEELLLPLRDVLARFEPIPLKSRDLTDLLISRGYARVLSKPKILTFADEPASVMIGQESDPNAPDSPSTDGYMKLVATPHVLEDQDAVRLSIDYKSQRTIGGEDDPNRPIFTTQIASTFVVPDGQAVAVVAGNTRIPHAPVHLLLVGPIRVVKPERAMEQAPDMMGARAIVESPTSSNTQTQNETLVPIDWMIAKALTEAVLDRETMLLIGTALARERPEIADEITGTDPGRKVTLGEVLRKYVTRQSLSPETGQALLELLTTRGFVEVQSTHPLVAADNRQFEIRKITEEWFPADTSQTGDKSALKKVEYGTVIKGTPHVASGGSIFMEMAVTHTEPAPQAQPGPLPVVRTMEVATTVTVPDNRYFSLLVESTDRKGPQTNVTESLLVMLKPRIVGPVPQPETRETRRLRLNHVTARRMRDLLPPAYQEYVNAETASASEPKDRAYIIEITGPATVTNAILDIIGKLDIPRRQVLLDVRVVEIKSGDLLNLGVEWSYPTIQAGGLDGDRARAILTGYTPDSTFTNSLMATLNLLESVKQANILSNPQVVALDGRTAQLRSVQEEWFMISDPLAADLPVELRKIAFETFLWLTPRISDANQITLEVTVEDSKAGPGARSRDSDLPIITRRQARNSITVQNGGTVAIAGLTEDPDGPNGKPPREIAIFVTARRVDVAQDGPPVSTRKPARMAAPKNSPPRQVVLDVRTISAERSDLMNLGVEWSFPVMEYPPSGGSNWFAGVTIGYTPDRKATDALDAAIARFQGRIEVLSSQQMVGLEGRLSRVRAVTEEWFRSDRPQSRTGIDTIASGTILSFTPRVDDANEITLEVTVEDSKALPRGRDSDLPIITRRQAKNSITVQNGGTVAIAGLTDSPKREPDRTAREIAVLVTATLVTESHQAAASPSSRQMEFVASRRIAEARERHVNADPLIREMSAQVVRMERDLIVSRQTLTDTHPEMVQKKTALQEFKNKLHERRSELEQEFDSDLAKHPAGSGDSAIEIVTARQAYVNADLLVQELTTHVVETQKDLDALQQTVSPSHPTLRQTSEAVEVFKRKLDERRAELERKFDTELMVENSRAASPGAPPTSVTSTNTDLFSALAQISKQSGVKIAVDLTVKPQLVTADLAGLSGEAAIRQVLKGTPYAFKCVTKADPPTYLVYRPIDVEFQGADLRLALQDIATKADLPVLPDSSVSGKVAARIEYASLEEALTAVLAGTHYLFKKASGHYIVTDGRPAIDGPARGDVPRVHLTATLATVLENQRFDRDTATEVFNLIAPAGTAPAEMSLTELRASTVGQILRQLGKQIPADRFKAVVGLLASKGLLDNVAEPQMVVPSGRTGEMMGEGQAVKVHVETMNGGQIIRLDAEASMQIFKPIPNDEKSNPSSPLTSVRKAKGSGSLEVPNDRHGLLALGGMSSGTDQADAETCYLILHPALVTPNAQEEASEEQIGANANRISQARPNMRQWNLVNTPETRHLPLNHQTPQRVLSLLPAKYQKYVHTEADNTSDSNQVLTVTAPSEITYTVVGMIRDFDSPPPQIFLNEWIVEMERADLLSLGVQWSFPTTQFGQTPADGGRPEGILIGFLSDGSSTDSLLARLNLLDITKRARILTDDQIISQDGRPTQLLSIPEVWANYPSTQAAGEASRNRKETRKILAGRLLSIVPHLGDHNDITFDIPVHVSNRVATESKDNFSNKPPSDIPSVAGRQAQKSITIMNGGTIVIAGLAKNTGRQSGRSREIAIFATASLIPARGRIENSLAASPYQSRVSVTPPPHENLLTVLAQICESSSIQIAVDPTVKRQSATADLVGLSGEAAIQQALKGTPYVFRRVSETDPPLYLVYRPITAEFDGIALGYALQDLAAKADVPVLPRGSVSGKVQAQIENVSLAEALDTVLTGTPYTVRKGQNCYFVAE